MDYVMQTSDIYFCSSPMMWKRACNFSRGASDLQLIYLTPLPAVPLSDFGEGDSGGEVVLFHSGRE